MSAPFRQYVGFWRRSTAFSIDNVWWWIVVGFLPFGPSFSTDNIESIFAFFTLAAQLQLLALNIVPVMMTGVMWAIWSTSPGKRALGIRIVDAYDGSPMTREQAVLRTLGYVVSALPFGLGFLWVAFDTRKQGWHDKLAGTVVIHTVDLDEAIFPADVAAHKAALRSGKK
ncbi:RDD family protein [Paraburkholderia sp. UCT31]|uniref:RDD family protein n=1 Tax=Paraburkholderia sp. UCT31 TaxID=2615209 RepID=UPI00165612A9|nr:RDD family protein [Paraburkholderia sp. UCT31]MBC8739828.1 RDD family protein [Paraburkholderia sp. UCT31]